MAPTPQTLEGLTSFRSRPNASFRFVLTLKANEMNVWLEDRKSKAQWQSGFLTLDAFVTSTNAIPGAKLAEYANCFKRALEKADGTKDDPVERELHGDKNKGLKLEFVVHIKVFDALWSPAYSLALKSIAIERIDIVESRLFDVEDDVTRLKKMEVPSALSTFTTTRNTKSGHNAVWKAISSSGDFAVASDGSIRALSDGTYVVALEVPYYVTGQGASVAMMKGNHQLVIESIWLRNDDNYAHYGNYGECAASKSGTAALSSVVKLKAGETVSIKVQAFRMNGGAKIAIAKITSA